MSTMKFVYRLILVSLLLPVASGQGASLTSKQRLTLSGALIDRLASASTSEQFHVLVRLADPTDDTRGRVSNLAASAPSLGDRYDAVGAHLRSIATSAQFTSTGAGQIVRRFWITNAVEMIVDRQGLLDLAERDDITLIAPNVTIQLLAPVAIADAVAASGGAESNLRAIGAHALWMRGLTGKGRLVASIDTGVEGIHPALANSWRGRNGNASAAWFDPLNDPAPSDSSGHGTHVMGIMVGRNGSDTIGLAPDAEWICAAVVDRKRSLSTTFADILAALQWVVDPDGNPGTKSDVPDVVCNSWGASQQFMNPCDQLFFDAIDNVESMGIVCVFAAGNEGPYTMSIRNPADRATSPTSSFSVGAVDARVAGFPVPAFSSRGPSACDGQSKKPEIAAPGVTIRSSYKGQTYKLISGTSMAAPHVAAAVALLRQYNPELTPEQIKTALLTTATDVDAPGEDNASGRGLINLEAALAVLPSPYFPVVTTNSVAVDPDGDGVPALGESVELVVSVSADVVDARNVTLHVSPLTSGAEVLSASSYIGTIPAGTSVKNTAAPFVVRASTAMRAGDMAWFEVSLSGDPLLTWWRDTVGVKIGVPASGSIAVATAGAAALTLSDYGLIGLAEGSSLNAGGTGWRTSFIGSNILYEGALMVSSGNGGWSDASRRDDGVQYFEFAPKSAERANVMCFDDELSRTPVGVTIDQRAVDAVTTANSECWTVSWTVRNTSGHRIDDFKIGWLLDIDLPTVGNRNESVSSDPTTGGIYHAAPNASLVAGVAPLHGPFGAAHIREHLNGKQPLSTAEKQACMTSFGEMPNETGDYFSICASNPVDLNPGDSVVIAIAFIAAKNEASFTAAGSDAKSRWLAIADVDDDQGGVRPPMDFVLEQNYPNPFNAGTTIPVSIAGDGSRFVRLDLFDVLGRRVRTLLDGSVEPGNYGLAWDGRSDDGLRVASGVYFARLTVEGQPVQVKSLVLIK